MLTDNKKYLNKDENRKFYELSDGAFMPDHAVLHASEVLERVKWVRNAIHEKACKYILDIGCKDGYTTLQLTAEGKECVAIDPSEDAINRARETAAKLDIETIYLHSFWEDYDLGKDPYIQELGKYDAVICMEVIEHVVDDMAFLFKLAQAGHYIFISTPDINGRHGLKDSKRNEAHVRLYSQDELEQIISQFADIVSSDVIDDQICICGKSRI